MRELLIAARKFAGEESGATMVEYALMVAPVVAVCVVAVTALGTAISGKLTSIAGSI